MSYRVFARKYRPQTFEEVIGQDAVIAVLRNAIRLQRLAQAYLFVGPRGIGKTSTARILAKALNCQKGAPAEPCGTCDSCIEIAESRSLDVLEIDGASHNGVENIRELRENVSFSPVRGPFKIYIIDEVHMLSSGAFNALLKTLEEPPSHVKFIFATTEIQKVPATISSRCQRFDLKRISPQLMASHLRNISSKEKISIEEKAAMAIATAADGALRDAESMLDQAVAFCGEHIRESDVLVLFGLTPRQVVADLSALVFTKKTGAALELIAQQVADGRDLGRLLSDWIGWLRDLLIQQSKGDSSADADLQNQASLISSDKLLELLDLVADAQSRMKWASDPQLQMDVTVIKAVHLLTRASLDDVLNALSFLSDSSISESECETTSLPTLSTDNSISPPSTSPAITVSPRHDFSSVSSISPKSDPPAVNDPPAPKKRRKKKSSQEEEGMLLEPVDSVVSRIELSATTVWESVAKETITESPFKFGWLGEANNAAFDGIHLRVCFPKTFKAQFESIFWGDIQSLLEKRLSQKRGSTTRLVIDLVEALPQESLDSSVSLPTNNNLSVESPKAPFPSVSTDPMEDFKNDPLIYKALEIFKGTIQTITT